MESDPYRSIRGSAYIRECVDTAGAYGFALFNCDGEIIAVSERRNDLFFEAARQDVKVVMPN